MKKNVVLFDLDNTLYAYEPCNRAGLKALSTYLQKRLHISAHQFQTLFTAARNQVHGDLHGQAASHSRLLYIQNIVETCQPGPLQLQLWQQAHTIFWQAYFKTMRLRPGMRHLLQRAKQQGYQIAIVTDLTTDIQIKKIQQLGIEHYIDALVTSEEVGKEKPHPAMIRRALQKLGCSNDVAIMIGDDERDQIAAKHCRIPYYRLNTNASVWLLIRQLFTDDPKYQS